MLNLPLHSFDTNPKRCHPQRFALEDGALLKPRSLDNRRNRPPVSTGGSLCAGLLLVYALKGCLTVSR